MCLCVRWDRSPELQKLKTKEKQQQQLFSLFVTLVAIKAFSESHKMVFYVYSSSFYTITISYYLYLSILFLYVLFSISQHCQPKKQNIYIYKLEYPNKGNVLFHLCPNFVRICTYKRKRDKRWDHIFS